MVDVLCSGQIGSGEKHNGLTEMMQMRPCELGGKWRIGGVLCGQRVGRRGKVLEIYRTCRQEQGNGELPRMRRIPCCNPTGLRQLKV